MAKIDDERYTKVNPEKLLDAADKIEDTVKKMLEECDDMDQAHTWLEQSSITNWGGTAHDQWSKEFTKALSEIRGDIEKYQMFATYIRKRAERYIRASIDAEVTGRETGENVRKMLAEVMEYYNIPTGGTATIGTIRSAVKSSPTTKFFDFEVDPIPVGTESETGSE